MTETPATLDIAEQQKNTAAFIGSVLNSSADPLLKAQADLLESVESTVTDWLHRRHEAVVDTQKLVARLRTINDPAEMLKAQQDWVTGAFRRLAADAAAAQSATLELVERSRGWIQQEVETAAESVAAAADEVVTRAADVSRRLPMKLPRRLPLKPSRRMSLMLSTRRPSRCAWLPRPGSKPIPTLSPIRGRGHVDAARREGGLGPQALAGRGAES